MLDLTCSCNGKMFELINGIGIVCIAAELFCFMKLLEQKFLFDFLLQLCDYDSFVSCFAVLRANKRVFFSEFRCSGRSTPNKAPKFRTIHGPGRKVEFVGVSASIVPLYKSPRKTKVKRIFCGHLYPNKYAQSA